MVLSRDGPGGFLVERERERVQFPFPFPFLSFRSRARYYRSRVRSLSVPVSVPGVRYFFLEQIRNRPVPVSVITVLVTVPARSSYRSWSVPRLRSGHLVILWNGSCDGPVLLLLLPFLAPFLVRSWPRSWSVPGPVPVQFHFPLPYFTGSFLGVGPKATREHIVPHIGPC